MKAYTYWKCSYCASIMRGDKRECGNCGAPIPNNVKYMMPNDPRVAEAKRAGQLYEGDNVHIDEKGVHAEIVKPEDERELPNWKCVHCGFQNFAEATTCAGCGAAKTDITYFDDEDSKTEDSSSSDDEYDEESEEELPHKEPKSSTKSEPEKETFFTKLITSIKDALTGLPVGLTAAIGLGFVLIPMFIWLFSPVWRTATVDGFEWTQTIEVEEFTLCHESDWSVPAGGRITDERQEIHHYETVIDHYETKSRQVSEEVFDGYDTEYREVAEQVFDGYDTDYIDLGNGQCDVVQTPRYRTEYRTESYQVPKYHTEWHTEYYEEPVYKDVPVYQTKYYYDIDRWLYHSVLTTHEFDHEPYWYETDIPEDVENPNYGDLRLGARRSTFTVHLINDEGEAYTLNYDYDEWTSFAVGDELRYKSFRFSRKPISDTEVIHKQGE